MCFRNGDSYTKVRYRERYSIEKKVRYIGSSEFFVRGTPSG
jgi:hypothetical protein